MEYEYLVDLRNYKRQFDLSLEKLAPRSNDELKLKVCVRYRPELTNARSNMALVEVNLPSGYVADNNPISMTTGDSSIEHVATSFGATTVIVYYGSVGSEPNCFVVTAYKRSRVSLKLPAYVLVQEFYEPTKTAIEAYNIEHDD
ncbi:hypothetical protein ZHAS_00004703 [Anopheles sinensis]|uniref:A2M_recep domain-containing protein n=1 Tax=Anopheles sinensis TaxID=74873 RepID=A0A084VHN8_ANOSI|nr:hypothetical protein ZHAS_00004703 [Anopheles sinensis]